MFFYLMLVAALLVLELLYASNRTKVSEKNFFYFGVFILIVVSICRGVSVGVDLENYISVVREMGRTGFNEIIHLFKEKGIFVRIDVKSTGIAMEGGFLILAKLIWSIGSSPQIFIIITSVVIIIGISFFIKQYSKNPCSSLIIFVLLGYYGQTMNVIRNYLAIVILLFSIRYLEEKKYFKFLAVVLIAFLLHRSAITFLLMLCCMYFAANSNRVKIYRGAIIAAMLILAMFAEQVAGRFIRLYYGYDAHLDTSWGINKMLFVLLFLYVFILIFSNKEFWSEKRHVLFVNALGIAMLVQVVAPYYETVGRIRIYFEIFLIILIPNLIESQKNYRQKILLKGLVYFVLIAFYFTLLRKDGPQIIPYIPFWEN